jgi:hypothetical protein
MRAAPRPGLCSLCRVLAHLVAARHEVYEHAQIRNHDHEDYPERLRESTEIVAAEDVAEHDDERQIQMKNTKKSINDRRPVRFRRLLRASPFAPLVGVAITT